MPCALPIGCFLKNRIFLFRQAALQPADFCSDYNPVTDVVWLLTGVDKDAIVWLQM